MGQRVLRALGFRTGFTHMEWYRKANGEAVFGEIAARPPGARSVDTMNYCFDNDVYAGWAEAVVHGRLLRTLERQYTRQSSSARPRPGRFNASSGSSACSPISGRIASVSIAAGGSAAPQLEADADLRRLRLRSASDLAACCALADRVGRRAAASLLG
jgi:hypothetical protein